MAIPSANRGAMNYQDEFSALLHFRHTRNPLIYLTFSGDAANPLHIYAGYAALHTSTWLMVHGDRRQSAICPSWSNAGKLVLEIREPLSAFAVARWRRAGLHVMMTRSEEYRARALDCGQHAKEASDRAIRQQWQDLAIQWHAMAPGRAISR
jgi:hypothetical protein